MNELTVILKDEDRTYKQDFLIYEEYSTSEDDPMIISCIDEARKNFQGEPESVQIRITMEM